MAHSLSAKKRDRQNVKRRLRNQALKSSAKTAQKRAVQAIQSKDAAADQSVKDACRTIDKMVSKGTYHKNTAARRKSRLMKKLNQSKQGA